jgi:hypothetical protein
MNRGGDPDWRPGCGRPWNGVIYDWNLYSSPFIFRLGPASDNTEWYTTMVLPAAWADSSRKQRLPRS